jgi:hypothetical protein
MLGVSNESGEFVLLNGGEGCVDSGKEARSDFIGAYSAANGVVVKAGISIQRGIAGPRETSRRRTEALVDY